MAFGAFAIATSAVAADAVFVVHSSVIVVVSHVEHSFSLCPLRIIFICRFQLLRRRDSGNGVWWRVDPNSVDAAIFHAKQFSNIIFIIIVIWYGEKSLAIVDLGCCRRALLILLHLHCVVVDEIILCAYEKSNVIPSRDEDRTAQNYTTCWLWHAKLII